jgi:hypothetical protein
MRTIDPSIMLAAMAQVHIPAPPSPKQVHARARRVEYAPVTPPATMRNN